MLSNLPHTSATEDRILAKIEASQPTLSQSELLNGARFVSACVPEQASVASIAIHLDAGSRRESLGEQGGLHFFEHLPPAAFRIANGGVNLSDFARPRGWSLNINISSDSLNFGISCPDFDADNAMLVLRETLSYPVEHYRAVFEVEKGRILNEIEQDLSNSGKQQWGVFCSRFMAGTGYAHPITGFADQVAGYSFDDIIGLGDRHLLARNATIAVSSNAGVIERAHRFFEGMSFNGTGDDPKKIDLSQRPRWSDIPLSSSVESQVVPGLQTNQFFRLPDTLTAREKVMLEIICPQLGNYLAHNLSHERGLTYGAGAGPIKFEESNFLSVGFNTSPHRAGEARAITKDLIERFPSTLVAETISTELLTLRNSGYLNTTAQNYGQTLLWMAVNPEADPLLLTQKLNIMGTITVDEMRSFASQWIRPAESRELLFGTKAALEAADSFKSL